MKQDKVYCEDCKHLGRRDGNYACFAHPVKMNSWLREWAGYSDPAGINKNNNCKVFTKK